MWAVMLTWGPWPSLTAGKQEEPIIQWGHNIISCMCVSHLSCQWWPASVHCELGGWACWWPSACLHLSPTAIWTLITSHTKESEPLCPPGNTHNNHIPHEDNTKPQYKFQVLVLSTQIWTPCSQLRTRYQYICTNRFSILIFTLSICPHQLHLLLHTWHTHHISASIMNTNLKCLALNVVPVFSKSMFEYQYFRVGCCVKVRHSSDETWLELDCTHSADRHIHEEVNNRSSLQMTAYESWAVIRQLPHSAGCWPPARCTLHCRWSRDCCLLHSRTTPCHDAAQREKRVQWVPRRLFFLIFTAIKSL